MNFRYSIPNSTQIYACPEPEDKTGTGVPNPQLLYAVSTPYAGWATENKDNLRKYRDKLQKIVDEINEELNR